MRSEAQRIHALAETVPAGIGAVKQFLAIVYYSDNLYAVSPRHEHKPFAAIRVCEIAGCSRASLLRVNRTLRLGWILSLGISVWQRENKLRGRSRRSIGSLATASMRNPTTAKQLRRYTLCSPRG